MTPKTVTLDSPIQRGEQTISEIVVRKPVAGQLRGLNMTDILQMDVNALSKLLPRITSPALTEVDISAMDPADLMQLGQEVGAFLLPKKLAYLTA
ncbi:phage tail assembly protein [Aeromonas caviae]|uniref:Tail protein n=1 Tax=Aeromonas caviae TaxID=648 RepID=A0AA37FW24_AERCA|nr:phage tail assembly protein [Aeromonas caviae]UBS65940.1 phage tail assembly protein [Aeromonas caviae]UBS65990.1 phage tail assembly protein [Aeromonas caviae]GJA17788.1 tail protein [Aeromonas caviae]GJA25970.1 tail protein [Aeromonas caviae]GJA62286.1 tail protein [Aeromonas caviae]